MNIIISKPKGINIASGGMKKIALLQSLQLTKENTLSFFDLDDKSLQLTYGFGKWNIREILHHLTDTELIYHDRIKRIIAEPQPIAWGINQDTWNYMFGYKHGSLNMKKQTFAACRELNYELTEQFYDLYGHKQFVHSQTGLSTLKDAFEKIVLHNQSHLNQMQKALTCQDVGL